MPRRLVFFLSIVMSAAIVMSSSLSAVSQETDPDPQSVVLGLFPQGGQDGDRFELTLQPGESAEVSAILASFSAEPVRLRTYVSHIVPVANGGLQIPPFDAEAEVEGSASWIEYPAEEITLSPGESLERLIRVSVPEGTPPGQYVNAVALETLDPVVAEGSPFEQYFRKVVSIYVTVPGDVVVDFELSEPRVIVNRGQSAIQFEIENTGTTRVDLQGNVALADGSGRVIHEGNVLLGPIYMGQSTIFQVPLPSPPEPGDDYSVSYSLSDRESSVEVSTDNQAVTVPEDTSASADAPVRFTDVSVVANADPIVFANVTAEIEVAESAFRSTRLVLSVFHNGELVEEFVMAENLSLEIGPTTVSQRYLPATNWESGTYTFSLKLESTSGGQTSLILEESDVATLEVP